MMEDIRKILYANEKLLNDLAGRVLILEQQVTDLKNERENRSEYEYGFGIKMVATTKKK